MPKTNNSAGQDIFAAAETVYTILTKHNIDACTIGSMAIAHTTKKAFGRDPNSLDFVTFQRRHNQRFMSDLLLTNYHDLFVLGNQSATNPHLLPAIFYKPQNSSKKIRVFFLPLGTQHSQENLPSLYFEDAVKPKKPYTIPTAPLPFIIYLQLHGWVWNNSIARRDLSNKRAIKKRDNFASDLAFLLPLAVKRLAHFDWLSDEFKERLKNNANEFVREYPALCQEWPKLGVSGVEVKPRAARSKKDKDAKVKHARGEEKPIKGEGKSTKGSGGNITARIDEQLELMEFAEAYPGGLDFDD